MLSESICNRMHLHIVFVLSYSVCLSVKILSCVDVIQSFTYLLHGIMLDITKRHRERAREKAIPMASHRYHQKRKEKRIKRAPQAVARLLLPPSSLQLPSPFTHVIICNVQ